MNILLMSLPDLITTVVFGSAILYVIAVIVTICQTPKSTKEQDEEHKRRYKWIGDCWDGTSSFYDVDNNCIVNL